MKLFNYRTSEKPDIQLGIFKNGYYYSTEGLLPGLNSIDDVLRLWPENFIELNNVDKEIEKVSYKIDESKI